MTFRAAILAAAINSQLRLVTPHLRVNRIYEDAKPIRRHLIKCRRIDHGTAHEALGRNTEKLGTVYPMYLSVRFWYEYFARMHLGVFKREETVPEAGKSAVFRWLVLARKEG